jgi:hypothetical protein
MRSSPIHRFDLLGCLTDAIRRRQTSAGRRGRAALCRLTLAALVPVLLSGCGRSVQLGEVEGTVQLDGQPIDNVMVVFVPENPSLPQSFGVTDEQGRFKLRCNDKRMGAVVGGHRVMLVDAQTSPTPKSRDDDEAPEGAIAARSRIPTIYNRANKTPLQQSVAAGSQTIAIEIASPKKPS